MLNEASVAFGKCDLMPTVPDSSKHSHGAPEPRYSALFEDIARYMTVM